MRTIAGALIDALDDLGVRHVFGVGGANIEHVFDALHQRGAGRISSFLAKREDGAAFMADGIARAYGTLGVCCCTSGGGMMNLAVGLAEAHNDGIPVLALVGQSPAVSDGLGAFQESTGRPGTVDAHGLLRSITKYTGRITGSDDCWVQLRAALTAALSGRPGPAALLVPRDVFAAPAGPAPADWPAGLSEFAARQEVPPEPLREVFDALSRAVAPVLLLGPELRSSPDGDAVVAFARRARIPVATSMSNRGDVDEDDPLYLGVVGVAGHPSVHRYLLEQADLVVAAGSDLGFLTRGPILDLKPDRVVVIAHDGSVARRSASADLVLEADAGRMFRALGDLLTAEPFQAPPFEYELRHYTPELEVESVVPAEDSLLASEAIDLLGEYLRPGDRVLTDAGNCGAAAAHLITLPPGGRAFTAFGMGGMGYTVPAAIGMQLGAPSGRTVVMLGDGAFLMNGLEIHTAVELGLPILYVVFNNAGHAMCASRQRQMFGGRIEGSLYHPVDVVSVARGLGRPDDLWVGSAGALPELRALLADYHAGHDDRPGVLELRLLRDEIPPMMPFVAADAPTHALTGRRVRPGDRS
ncbi:thiamine pyrophosphate-binding protein [Micromonospora sp. NPDC049101]|uniref:thiamine pyrophosphate-binding protein n=1 Tax=Micromonospora sp. NPDC049101 TaxID=3155032 RepID=UPI0033C0345B